MGKASKKIALIESKCDFNIDGMKLFRFHSYSDTDFLSHEEIPDTHENCLSFILCSTGKIRIQLLNGQIISACQQDVVCISEKVNLSLFETEREASGFLLIAESPKIQNSLWKITKIMGNWNLDIHSAIQYTEQIGGRYLIRNNLWVFSLFSVLDVILEKPMEEALEMVYVAKDIKDALGQKKGKLAPVLEFMEQYETANWQEVSRLMILQNIEMEDVYEAYISSLKWYRELMFPQEEKKA